MNTRPNPDLLIAAWLDEEARDGAPERLVEATRRQLVQTNQRRVVWPARRLSPMNIRIAVAAAAIVVAVVGAYLILPRPSEPGASTTPSPSPSTEAFLPDGRYESQPQQVSAIRTLMAADTTLTASDKTSIEDAVLGIRDATTFQSAIEIRGGDQLIAGQRTDGDDFTFEAPWAFRRIDDASIEVTTACCGKQTYQVEQTAAGFRLTAVSPTSSALETFVRHITFEMSPFTRVPSGAAAPTGSPTASAQAISREGPLAAGRYSIKPFVTAPSLTLEFTVPSGWSSSNGFAVLPPFNGAIAFLMANGVYSDPCHWDTDGTGSPNRGDVTVGPSAGDLASALASQTAYTSTAPVDITLGGYSGKQVDLQLPSEARTGCDTEGDPPEARYFVWSNSETEPNNIFQQSAGERRGVLIVDVDGMRIIVLELTDPQTPADGPSAIQAVVDSMEITP